MKKELEESLRHMQSHPTTGTPHNAQVISTQVETIFMLNGLREEIVKLNKTIEASDKQSQKLEVSNYKLQWAMLVLTAIATMIVAYPILLNIINSLSTFITQLLSVNSISVSLISTLAGILSAIVGPLIVIYAKKLHEMQMVQRLKLLNLKDSVK